MIQPYQKQNRFALRQFNQRDQTTQQTDFAANALHKRKRRALESKENGHTLENQGLAQICRPDQNISN